MSMNTDTELVKRAQRGDKQAFDLLVLKYQHRIINLISRFVHNFYDAQDISQEVFVKSYRALPNFRGDSAFYTWLYRIAINTAKNHLTVKARKSLYYSIDINDAAQIEKEDALKNKETPEQLLLRDEIQQTIINAIVALPENLRVAITLREVDGLNYEDIASVMGCPIGTVRSRIFRAREAIDKALKLLI